MVSKLASAATRVGLGMAVPEIVDREAELAELRALAAQRRPAIVLVYGRRRVGKTYLLERAWPGERLFYFLAADTTPQLNRAELLRELAAAFGEPVEPQDYPTWRSVFRLLFRLAEREPLIVVLDEFQYLLGAEDDIVSQLTAVWDREARGRPLLLALSGSEVSVFEQLAGRGSPLYGRLAWRGELRPFDYRDAARMLPGRSPREAACFYGALGGTPAYLRAVPPRASLAEALAALVLSPRGEVHLQLEHRIEQEKGIRQPAEYRAVLAAVGGGRMDLNGIVQLAGLAERPHVARRALSVLEGLDLVCRERNFRAPPKAPYRYRIADPAVRFWYHFVHPNRSRLEAGDPREVWEDAVAPSFDGYMEAAFEAIAAQAFRRHHRDWGYAAPVEWSRWEGQDRSRRPIEIDVVAELADGRVLAGEVKWHAKPVDYDVHLALVRDLEALAESGYGWARDCLSADRSAGFIYFSAGGFTEYFRRKAAGAGIRLLALADLYAD